MYKRNGYKVVNQYLDVFTLQNKFNSNFITSSEMAILSRYKTKIHYEMIWNCYMKIILQNNYGGNNKHEIALCLFLLLDILSGFFLLMRMKSLTEHNMTRQIKVDMKNYNR